jgi:hypothetical protein
MEKLIIKNHNSNQSENKNERPIFQDFLNFQTRLAGPNTNLKTQKVRATRKGKSKKSNPNDEVNFVPDEDAPRKRLFGIYFRAIVSIAEVMVF